VGTEFHGWLYISSVHHAKLLLLRNRKAGVKPVIYRVTLKPHSEISIVEDRCLLKRLLTGIK